MARLILDPKLRSRTARRELPIQHSPYWVRVSRGCIFGYRKGSRGGIWLAKWSQPGKNATRLQMNLGIADDVLDANGLTILNFDQAQAKAREWFDRAHEQGTGQVINPVSPTIAHVVAVYLEDCERRLVKGVAQIRCTFDAHVLPELGDLDAAALNRSRIESWMKTMADCPPRVRIGKKQSEQPERPMPSGKDEVRARRSTVNRVWTNLRSALNHAVDRDLLKDNSGWRKVKPFSGVDVARVRFLNPQEQARLVNGSSPEFRILVKGALLTGARYGELTRLAARDFNAISGTVFIEEGKGADGGRARHVVLTQEGQDFFEEVVIGMAPTELLFTRCAHKNRNKNSETLIRGWGKSEQSRFMKDACENASLERLTFHELRHTYASALVNAGVPLAFIAEQLGHVDTKMVEKHYGHLCPSAKAEAIRKLAPNLGIHTPRNLEALRFGKTVS